MVIAACLAWTRPPRVFTMAAEAPTAAVGRWHSLLWSAAEVPDRRAACPRREAGSIEGSAAGRSSRPAFLGDPSFAWPVIRRPDGCVAGLGADRRHLARLEGRAVSGHLCLWLRHRVTHLGAPITWPLGSGCRRGTPYSSPKGALS